MAVDKAEKVLSWIIILIVTCQGEDIKNYCTNDYVSIPCSKPRDCLISLSSAFYAHSVVPAQNCSSAPSDCVTNATDVWHQCQGQRACAFYVRQEHPRGYCEKPSQHLTIKYDCRCAASCKLLPPILSGDTVYSRPYLTRGVEARFSCRDGHVLVGPSVRRCQPTAQWSAIQPACSAPVSTCPNVGSQYLQTFGYSCYELIPRSLGWNAASDDCRERGNGTLALIRTQQQFEFLKWWFSGLSVYGYIWVDLRGNGTRKAVMTTSKPAELLCPEFFMNSSEVGTHSTERYWALRQTNCAYKNQYVCQYDVSQFAATAMKAKMTKDLALGLGLGLGIGLLLVFFIVVMFFCNKMKKKSKGDDEYDSVGDPETISTRTLGAASSTRDLVDRQGTPAHAVYTNQDCLPGGNGQGVIDLDRVAEPDGAIYDDVYLPRDDGEVSSERSPTPPPTSKRPAHPQRSSYPKGAHRHAYENVLVHSLTESLRRKLLPRKLSNRLAARQKPKTGQDSRNVHSLSEEPETAAQKYQKNGTRNGESTLVSHKPYTRRFKEQTLMVPASQRTCSSLERDSERSSNGVELFENELYDRRLSRNGKVNE